MPCPPVPIAPPLPAHHCPALPRAAPTCWLCLQETAAAMAQAVLLPGTPARTLALLLAGRPDLIHVPQPTTSAPGGDGAASSAAPPSPLALASAPFAAHPHAPPAGFFNPYAAAAAGGGGGHGAAAGAAAGGGMLGQWREHLAIMLTNRCPGDQEAVIKLGDRLASSSSGGDGGQVGFTSPLSIQLAP